MPSDLGTQAVSAFGLGDAPDLALADTTVLELGEDNVASSFGARLLGGYGARVVKIEAPGGDPLRHAPPLVSTGDGRWSALFAHLSEAKESVALDMTAFTERVRFGELLQTADIVIDGLGRAARARAGIDWADARRKNPGAVVAVIEPYGSTGPNRDRAATELTILAESGYLDLCGDPERLPVKPYGYQAHRLAGLHAALASLSARRMARRTGRGRMIDISIQESLLFCLGGGAAWFQHTGEPYRRAKSRVAHSLARARYPGNILRCGDGLLFMNTGHNQESVAVLLGEPSVGSQELWDTAAARGDELDALCERWTMTCTRAEASDLGQELRVGIAPVLSPQEVLDNEHLAARRFFVSTPDDDERGLVPGAPVRMSQSAWVAKRPPGLGEQTAAVLGGLRTGRAAVENPAAEPAARGGGLPLEGVRVLDVTEYVAGPIATQALVSLGAEVIKIERPYLSDHRQQMYSPIPEGLPSAPDEPWNRVLWFNELNRGKTGIALDLSHAEGADIFRRLAAISDVVIDNFSARVMPNLGLDYERLRSVNPSIISLSISGYGATGPWANWIASGPSIDSASGMAWLTGYPDGSPMRPGNFNPDIIAGLMAPYAIVVALEHRDRTGVGQKIDLSMLENVAHFLGEAMIATGAGGAVDERQGNREPEGVPSGVYPTGDGRAVALSVTSDAAWRALAGTLGEGALRPLVDATAEERRARHAELERAVETWTRSQTLPDIVAMLDACKVAYGVVNTSSDLHADAHLIARGAFLKVPELQIAETLYPRFAWLIEEVQDPAWAPAHLYGQHSVEVFRDMIGLSEQDIQSLYDNGVSTNAPTLF